MTGTPTHARNRWSSGGAIPEVDARNLDELVAVASTSDPSEFLPPPWVLVEPFSDEKDPAVFGVAFAVWLVKGQPWLVRGVLRSVKGGPSELARVAVEHFADPGREVTGAVMREINFATIRNSALRKFRERGIAIGMLRGTTSASFEHYREAIQRGADEAAKETLARGLHGGYPAEHYRHIAHLYLELVENEGRRDILKALCEKESERLGEPIKRERMRDWVKKATRMGYLAPGQRGIAGRQPGPNLETKESTSG